MVEACHPIDNPSFSRTNLFMGDTSGTSPYLSFIHGDRVGGDLLRQNIAGLARVMGGYWKTHQHDLKASGVVVGIPRGGVYMGKGLQTIVPEYSYVETNQGLHKNPHQQIVTFNIKDTPPIKDVLVADTALFTGKTIRATLDSILPQIAPGANIVVFIAIAYKESLDRLLSLYPHVKFYVGEIQTKIKHIYDPRLWRLVPTLANIGDIGELVSR